LGAAAGEAAEPQPEVLPTDCFCWCEGAAGLESKKLPPLSAEKAELFDWGAGRGDPKDPRPEKASFWAGLGDDALAKFKLLKASLSPPAGFCTWLMPVGEDIPLNEPDGAWETCWAVCWGCGRGAVA
jgi:hypothetical protein